MYIIGSSSSLVKPYLLRKTVDHDVLCTKEEFSQFMKDLKNIHDCTITFVKIASDGATMFVKKDNRQEIFEFTFIDCGKFAKSNDVLISYMRKNQRVFRHLAFDSLVEIEIEGCIDLQFYYLQKMSHRFLKNSKHFVKTRNDILHIEEDCGISLAGFQPGGVHFTFYEQRVKETYNYSHPNLNQEKKTFFTDEVGYVYDHDDIHQAVKMLDKPAYMYYIEEGEQVRCSKKLFNQQPEIVKLYGVLEEAYVLALERSIIPYNTTPSFAFNMALEKVCTSITSGWFREYAWRNYDKVEELYHDSFVYKFDKANSDGKIRPFRYEETMGKI